MQLDRRTFLAMGAAVLAGCSTQLANGDSGPAASAAPFPSLRPEPGTPTSVVMVGDSITAGSLDELNSAFALVGVTTPHIDGVPKRRIEVGSGKKGEPLSGLKTIDNLLALGLKPDAWVIELGTNDIGSYSAADDYAHLIDEVLAKLSPTVPLAWVNTYREQYLQATNVFNLVLKERLQRRGHSQLVDWFAAVSPKHANLLVADHIHPNATGQRVLSLLVAQALQRL